MLFSKPVINAAQIRQFHHQKCTQVAQTVVIDIKSEINILIAKTNWISMQLSKHLFYTETKNIMNRAILVQLFFTVLVFIQLNLYSCSLRS